MATELKRPTERQSSRPALQRRPFFGGFLSQGQRDYCRRSLDTLLPQLPMHLTDFAERKIVIPTGEFKGQPLRHQIHPVSRLWFQAIDSRKWTRYAMTGPGQAGKSLLGFVVPVMWSLFELGENVGVGIPDMKLAHDKWDTDFRPAIQASFPDQMPLRGEGSAGGQVKGAVTFRGGSRLRFMTPGQGDAGLAGFTVRVAVLTETDKYDTSSEVSREAPPIDQMEARTNHYADSWRLLIHECTASIPSGHIWNTITSEGTDSRIHHPCCRCGTWVPWDREHLVGWEEAADELAAKELAAWKCPACGETFGEHERREMMLRSVLAHRGQTVELDGTVSGPEPRTETFGLRWTAFDNPFRTTGRLGQVEWLVDHDQNREAADKSACQFTWGRPYQEPDTRVDKLEPDEAVGRTSGLRRGICPAGTIGVVVGVDTAFRHLNWTAVACGPAGLRIIDYGDKDLDYDRIGKQALLLGLHELYKFFLPGWTTEDGRRVGLSQAWVDSNFPPHQPLVYAFLEAVNKSCRMGAEVWRATMGHGEGQLNMSRYYGVSTGERDVVYVSPNQYHIKRIRRGKILRPGVTLVHINSDPWKTAVHNGFVIEEHADGAILLFEAAGSEDHLEFCTELAAEVQVEKWIKERGNVTVWIKPRKGAANHYLDSTYLAVTAADFVMAHAQKAGNVQFGAARPQKVPMAERARLARAGR